MLCKRMKSEFMNSAEIFTCIFRSQFSFRVLAVAVFSVEPYRDQDSLDDVAVEYFRAVALLTTIEDQRL